MENEKELLEKELATIEDKAGLEQFKQDAEDMGHEELAALAQEKIDALTTQAESVLSEPAKRMETVQSLGGTAEGLQEVVAPMQKEIEEVQEEAKQEIAEVEKNKLDLIEKPKNLDEISDYISKIRSEGKATDESIRKLFSQIKAINTEEKEKLLIPQFDTRSGIEQYAKGNNLSYDDAVKNLFDTILDDADKNNFQAGSVAMIDLYKLASKKPELESLLEKRSSLGSELTIFNKINTIAELQKNNPEEAEKLVDKYKYFFTKRSIGDGDLDTNIIIAKELVKLGLIEKDVFEKELNTRIDDIGNNYHPGPERDRVIQKERDYWSL